MYPYCKENAFTLFELIAILAILIILISLGIPYFERFQAKQEIAQIYPLIQQQVSLAKNTARMRQSEVVICSSENQQTCGKNQWNKSLIIFIDDNHNKKYEFGETVIRITNNNFKYGELQWRGGVANLQTVTFQSDTGLPRGSQGAFYYCSFKLSGENLYIPISQMGNTRLVKIKKC